MMEDADDLGMSLEDAIVQVDVALRHASDACSVLADEFEPSDRWSELTKAFAETDEKKRRGMLAIYAANEIADDRYSAGSTAAKAVMQVLLKLTVQDVINFIADIEHNES